MKITENFTREEFDCKDGTPYPEEWIETRLLYLCDQLEIIRQSVNVPIYIISGYRTKTHNKKEGGGSKSQHLEGRAVDIMCKGLSAANLGVVIQKLIENGKIHNGGLGIYKNWIHYDTRKTPARW